MTAIRYLPELENIHDSWFAAWGDHIGSGKLGSEIFANTRLRNRAFQHLLASSDLDLDYSFSVDQVTTFRMYADQRDRLVRICGLVMHGRVFRENISRAGFDELIKLLQPDELRIAVGLRALHPETDGLDIDLQRINELVERSGRHCVKTWIAGLDEQARLRINLMADAKTIETTEDSNPGPELAEKIVTEVSKALISDRVLLAA